MNERDEWIIWINENDYDEWMCSMNKINEIGEWIRWINEMNECNKSKQMYE